MFVAVHYCSLIWSFSARVLYIIKSFTVCFPNIDLYILYWLAGSVFNIAKDKARLAIWIVRDDTTIWCRLGLMGVEGTKHGAFRALWWLWMIDGINEQRQPKDV